MSWCSRWAPCTPHASPHPGPTSPWPYLTLALPHHWPSQVLALGAYRAAYGDCNVPSGFVVPSEAPWPPACWAMPLGNRVNALRSKRSYLKGRPDREARLGATLTPAPTTLGP